MKETRINKWKKYRQDILENTNIEESIINSDRKLKSLMSKINININEINTQDSKIKKHKIVSYKEEKEEDQINDLLQNILANENMKAKKQVNKEYNSHSYDEKINSLFSEFKSNKTSSEINENEIKITKIVLDSEPNQAKHKNGANMNKCKKINIAIDGPSGVGKSTVAKKIADELGLTFVNTGLMYRAIAFYCLENNIDTMQELEVENILKNIEIFLFPNNEIQLNGKKINSNLLSDEISINASIVAKYKSVRNFCVALQQEISSKHPGVVMEGRDIGTVVLPNADLKIFLTANAEIRAQRRINQLIEKGEVFNAEEIWKNIVERDERDINRSTAPLIKANDAIEIDTSLEPIESIIDKISSLARNKMK